MALSDVTPQNARKGPPCQACLMVAGMTPDDRATLDVWMADPGRTTDAILARLAEEGYVTCSDATFTRHRAGKCWGRRHGLV